MAHKGWQTKRYSVASLHLDPKNPRLGRETQARAPRDIIQYLFDHDNAVEVADSIATRGYFPNEPLLAVREAGKMVVIEGNRRLAALKALREPGLLAGAVGRKVERLASRIIDPAILTAVPVTLAPSRHSTDRQIAARHVGTPVRAWRAENRASFILDKLQEGYSNEELRDELGFTLSDIQGARQTRAIADMARSLDLPEEVKVKIEEPGAKAFTTLERVFDSSVGRDFLRVEPDPDHGLRGHTSKSAFTRAFRRLVTDIALGKQSSRTLNKNENIRAYFETWPPDDLPGRAHGSFIPSDIIAGRSVASPKRAADGHTKQKKAKPPMATVLPRDFKVRVDSERLIDIARELKKLKRADFPNAGAVLLRVFLELAMIDYLKRTGEMETLVDKLRKGGNRLPYDIPTMKQLCVALTGIAKARFPTAAAARIEKALRYDASAPFSISDLHSFVHSDDLPGERDILQFWLRTEPLLRLMVDDDSKMERR